MRSQFLSLLIGYILPLVTFLTKRPVQRRPGLPLSRGRALIQEVCLQMLRSPMWKALASAVQCVTQAAQTKARYGTRTRKPFIPWHSPVSRHIYIRGTIWHRCWRKIDQGLPWLLSGWSHQHTVGYGKRQMVDFFFFVAWRPIDFAGQKWAEGEKAVM